MIGAGVEGGIVNGGGVEGGGVTGTVVAGGLVVGLVGGIVDGLVDGGRVVVDEPLGIVVLGDEFGTVVAERLIVVGGAELFDGEVVTDGPCELVGDCVFEGVVVDATPGSLGSEEFVAGVSVGGSVISGSIEIAPPIVVVVTSGPVVLDTATG